MMRVVVVMIMMQHECDGGWFGEGGTGWGGREERILRGEDDRSVFHACI
jgi:hypothetical protein